MRARPDPIDPDQRIWRVLGDPLVPPTGSGPLDGEDVAVKDLYAVAGQRVGAGNPQWLAAAPIESTHADAVALLLNAGASVRGISRTDEFAYSLAGINAHYGAPPNSRAPGRISGGSSSGSATAVGLAQASIGLGTDTAGSIRVPASYQGLWGIRTTHGAVPIGGLLPLAPSFDTVGWLTRGAALLRSVASVLLPGDTGLISGITTSTALLALAAGDVREAVAAWIGDRAAPSAWDAGVLPGWLAAFQTVQAWEAWQQRGEWLRPRLDGLAPDVRTRFERGSAITADQVRTALDVVAQARDVIRSKVGDGVLALPSAASVAPRLGDAAGIDAVRQATLALTCIASIAGLPAVSVPLPTADGLPTGVGLIGPAGSDRALIDLAGALDLGPFPGNEKCPTW
ncbi:MAG: glutamyl-tRNA amidotransferase [Pseudonocardiales bacterium]|nr:glutamyl-tRNA amidotransferase [Pseudonocardiales bacterium]